MLDPWELIQYDTVLSLLHLLTSKCNHCRVCLGCLKIRLVHHELHPEVQSELDPELSFGPNSELANLFRV